MRILLSLLFSIDVHFEPHWSGGYCTVQCSEPVRFWYGSGSESADPYHGLTDPDSDPYPDPDPARFISDRQDAKKIFLAYYFLKIRVHFHHSLKILTHKEITKQ